MDAHQDLARKMDRFPLGAPLSEELIKILRQLFSPIEAETALHLSPRPLPLADLAEACGRDPQELGSILKGMTDKGLIYARPDERGGAYSLLPIFPGIFELQFMSGGRGPTKTRLAGMFEDYYLSGMNQALSQAETSFARVIPVERHIPTRMEIFPFERVSSFIREENEFALATCYCRHEKELLGQACDAPRQVCMIFGPFARFTIKQGFAQKVSLTRMLSALEEAEEAGLVHVSDNVTDRINFLCNCCGCCCGFLRTITELGRANVVAASRFVAVHEEADCTLCQTCVDICQVSAITVDDERIVLDENKCLGCGACTHHCPTQSLTLNPRQDYDPPWASLARLQQRLLQERGLAE